jgi:tetratricopeptide (TPR) repeat protein
MNFRAGHKLSWLIKLWPLLPIIFFFYVLWFVSERIPQLVRWEHLRTNFAQMLQEEQAAREAIDRLNRLPADSEGRLAAREALASVFIYQRRYQAAQAVYLDVLKIESALKRDTTATLLSLAGLYRDMGKFDRAAYYYQQVWNSDKERLPKTDPRLVRDLNNLGVVCYLVAMATEDHLERELELNRANFYLIQAEIVSAKQPGQDAQNTANIWENRALVVRELGNIKEANNLKKRAQVVHNQMPNRIDPP